MLRKSSKENTKWRVVQVAFVKISSLYPVLDLRCYIFCEFCSIFFLSRAPFLVDKALSTLLISMILFKLSNDCKICFLIFKSLLYFFFQLQSKLSSSESEQQKFLDEVRSLRRLYVRLKAWTDENKLCGCLLLIRFFISFNTACFSSVATRKTKFSSMKPDLSENQTQTKKRKSLDDVIRFLVLMIERVLQCANRELQIL